jgi:hypothetical protein
MLEQRDTRRTSCSNLCLQAKVYPGTCPLSRIPAADDVSSGLSCWYEGTPAHF